MKTKTKNVFWGLLLILVLLIFSHLEYGRLQEEKETNKMIEQAEAEERFYEYHYNK